MRRAITVLLAGLATASVMAASTLDRVPWFLWPVMAIVTYWILRPFVGFPFSVRDGYRDALREDRRKRGLCLGCGYNLRATPGRCPECGAVPKGGAA